VDVKEFGMARIGILARMGKNLKVGISRVIIEGVN